MDEHVVGRERTLVYVEVKPLVVEDEVGRAIADLDGITRGGSRGEPILIVVRKDMIG